MPNNWFSVNTPQPIQPPLPPPGQQGINDPWGQPENNIVQQITQQLHEEYMTQQALNKKSKKDPSPSRMIDTHQIPTKLLESSLESIDRELEERASALSEIARLLEVVEETDSTIRYHISNLRRGAIRSGKMKYSELQSYQDQSEQDFGLNLQTPQPTDQIVGAAAPQVVPALWPADQG